MTEGPRLPAAIRAPQGWRGLAAAIALGALATAALPPISVWPALFPAFSGLLWLLDGARTPRQAFVIGWGFGLGHFATGLYWIANALLLDPSFWWMVPFGVLGLPAFLSLFVGAALAAWRWGAPEGPARLLLLAAMWSVAELARGHLLTGFPWNLIGYAWWGQIAPMQGAALVGVYGLGFVTVLAAAAPGLWLSGAGLKLSNGGAAGLAPGLAAASVVALAPLAGVAVWGWMRIADAPNEMTPDVRLRLVQPNISQLLKLSSADRITSFERLLDLSARPAERPPTVLIWPETSTPFLLEREPYARAAIVDLLAPGASAIVGAPRAVAGDDGKVNYYNGLVAIDADDLVRGVYDKFHLVPFGEYVPLRGVLPIQAIANRETDYSFGSGPRTLRLPGAPAVGPLICYEAVFPGAVLDPTDRPAWLLNLTNDAWYGASSGPYQHFAIVAMRAIEEGLPMVRVANSGISGVVDPYGRVTARLGLDVAGVLDVELPQALTGAPLYASFGDAPLWILILLVISGRIGQKVWSERKFAPSK